MGQTKRMDDSGTSGPTSDYETGLSEDEQLDIRIWLRLLTCANLIERRVRKNLRDEFNTTFVFSTHDPKVMKSAEIVFTLEDGKLLKRLNDNGGTDV